MDTKEVDTEQSAHYGLNTLSEEALRQFARFGAYLEGGGGEPVLTAADRTGVVGAVTNLQTALYEKDAMRSEFRPSLLGRALSVVGGTLEAATGIGEVAKQFNRDFSAGDRSYRGTMHTVCSSLARSSLGFVAGYGAAAAAAAVFSGAIVPIAVGTAAGFGVSYLWGKVAG